MNKHNKKQTDKYLIAASAISLLFVTAELLCTLSSPVHSLPHLLLIRNDIDVDIDEDPIKRGDTQDITVTVRNADTGKRVSDADVKLSVYPPDSDSTSATDGQGKD